jgi:hypothetical protein
MDRLLRWVVLIVVIVFAVIAFVIYKKADLADRKADALHAYLWEQAPLVRGKLEVYCQRIDSVAVAAKRQPWGDCVNVATPPKDPPKPIP